MKDRKVFWTSVLFKILRGQVGVKSKNLSYLWFQQIHNALWAQTGNCTFTHHDKTFNTERS